ncbi:hypothetical protein THO17_34000 [Marinomonas sp. THO17]
MKAIATSACLLLVSLQTSCKTKGAYEAFQQNHVSACRDYLGQQQDDCLASHNKSFEAYQRARANDSK